MCYVIRNKNKTPVTTEESRSSGYFCSETVFSLSNRVLSDAKIRILEKGLGYTPNQRKINEPELRHYLNDFCRSMRLKWYFHDEPDTFSETSALRPKSPWVPPIGYPCLEVFRVRQRRNCSKCLALVLDKLICLKMNGMR